MSYEFNMQITQIYAKKYSRLSRGGKSELLKEYCSETGISRNLASKRFRKVIREIYPHCFKGNKTIQEKRT